MNDAPVDIGIVRQLRQPGDARSSARRCRSPASSRSSTTRWNEQVHQLGRLLAQDIDNTDGQAADAYKTGQYALGNLLYTPVPNVMVGGEFQWGRRENFSDGFQQRRRQAAVLVQVQLLAQAWRLVMIDEISAFAWSAAGVAARGWLALSRRNVGRPGAGADVQKAVDAAYAKFRTLKEGKNADYIPALAKVDPNLFGIALVTADGKVYTAGDVKTEVSIQSISKVFTMAQVIQEQGLDSIEKRIGVDATGARFNSIIADRRRSDVVGTGAPEMNPLVNPGAISATSMVTGAHGRRGVEEDHRLPQRRRRALS